MKHNFHTHTIRCKHAIGSDEDFVKAALEGGFDVLGFADHAPWAFATDYVSHCRMPADQWTDYKQSVLSLKEKYQGQISICLGLECEYYQQYFDQLRRLRDDGCQYFNLACHYLHTEETNPYIGMLCQQDDEVLHYAEETVKGIRTGLFSLCHPSSMCCMVVPPSTLLTNCSPLHIPSTGFPSSIKLCLFMDCSGILMLQRWARQA